MADILKVTRDAPCSRTVRDKPLQDALAVRRATINNILDAHSGLGAAQADVKRWEDL